MLLSIKKHDLFIGNIKTTTNLTFVENEAFWTISVFTDYNDFVSHNLLLQKEETAPQNDVVYYKVVWAGYDFSFSVVQSQKVIQDTLFWSFYGQLIL